MCVEKFNEQAHEGKYWSPTSHWAKPFNKRQEVSTDPNSNTLPELCDQGVRLYLGFAITYTIVGILLMVRPILS